MIPYLFLFLFLFYVSTLNTTILFPGLCPITHADLSYQRNLKLSENNIDVKKDCYPKNDSLISRKIFIFNVSNSHLNEKIKYDKTYNSISTFFQNESKFISDYMFPSLIAILENGDHIISDHDLEIKYAELFRRSLVNLTITAENGSSKIYLRTNKLFLFVSSIFTVKNLIFFGNDINLQESVAFNDSILFCQEDELVMDFFSEEAINTTKRECFLKNRVIEKINKINNYGFFNIEDIFSKDDFSITPKLIVVNCSFKNFYPLNKEGFLSLISISPFSVSLEIKNSKIENSFFYGGVIYYSKYNYDRIYSKSIIDLISSNFEGFIQRIVDINSLNILNYNCIKIISDQSFNLILLSDLNGNFSFQNSVLHQICEIKPAFEFEGTYHNMFFNNSFSNFQNSSLIVFKNIYFCNILQNFLFGFIQGGIIFIFNEVKAIEINSLDVENVYLGDSKSFFEIKNCYFQIKNSEFINLQFQNLISQEQNTLLLSNNSFENCTMNENFIYFISTNGYLIVNTIFFKAIFGNLYFFVFQKGNFITVDNTYFENIIVYAIFYLIDLSDIIIQNYVIAHSYIIYMWENDFICKNILVKNALIQNNKIGICLIRILSKEIYTVFWNVLLYNNSFLLLNGGHIIYIQIGIFLAKEMKILDNYFLDPDEFVFLLDFEKKNQAIIENCIIKDSGIITKKHFYLAFSDNAFFCIWQIASASFISTVMFASDKIELTSGFISAAPLGNALNIINCTFIIEANNSLFEYKGLLLDSFKTAVFLNNSFYKMKCNTRYFSMKYGGIILSSSVSFKYGMGQNDIKIYMENNNFYNCSCFFGGSFAIIAINQIDIINTKIYNSQCEFSGGSIFIAGAGSCNITNLEIINSKAFNGAGAFFLNIFNLNMEEISLKNLRGENTGALYINNINNCNIQKIHIFNVSSDFYGGSLFIIRTSLILQTGIFNMSSGLLHGGILWIDDKSSIILSSILCENSYAYKGGGFYIKDIKQFTLSKSTIIASNSFYEGAFLFLEHSFLNNFTNISITRCQGEPIVSLIFIEEDNEKSQFNFEFYNCFLNQGFCLYFSSASRLILNHLAIYKNENCGIFIGGLITINAEINELLVYDCNSSNSMIILSNINIKAQNIIIKSNNAKNELINAVDFSGNFSNIMILNNSNFRNFYFIRTNVQINEVEILKQKQNSLYVEVSDSILAWNSSLFCCSQNNNSIESLLIFYGSEISFKFCRFVSNINSVFNIIDSIKIIFEFCYFINNTNAIENQANDILVQNTFQNMQTNIFILRCEFEVFGLISCDFKNSNQTQIVGTHYFKKSTIKFQTQAIIFNFNFNVMILESNFSFFTNNALFINNNDELLDSNYSLDIRSTCFNYNIGGKGSSIYIQGDTNVFLFNVSFLNNEAFITKNDGIEGIGPCVFYQAKNNKICSFFIFKSFFINNRAKYIAPTIFSQNSVQIDKETLFENNSDSYNFSTRVFSYPILLETLYFRSENNESHHISYNDTLVINSGCPFNINFAIRDFFGQILIFDNISLFVIKKSNTYKETLTIKNNLESSVGGIINFDALTVNIFPNTFFYLTISGFFSFLPKEQQKITKEFHLYSRNCKIGEIILMNLSCIPCPPNTFSLINPMEVEIKFQRCNSCPSNSECSGKSNITPKKGYFRYSNISTNVVECFNSEACIGNISNKSLTEEELQLIQIHGACMKGNRGPLCSICEKNYGRYDQIDICKECSSLLSLIIIRTMFCFLFMSFYLFVNSFLAENYDAEKKTSNGEIYAKIMINHCQQINIIILSVSKFSIPEIPKILSFGEYFSFTNDQAFTNECLIESFLGEKIDIFSFIKVMINSLLPIIISILAFLIWIVLISIKERFISKRKRITKFKPKFFLFCLLSLYIFYPLIIKSCFGLFECIKLDPDLNITFAKKNLELICWEEKHLHYIIFFAFPGLIIWGIGFPLFLIWRIKSHIVLSTKAVIKTKKTSINALFDKKKLNTSGFFYKGMKKENYYWESLILYRKFLLCMISSLNFETSSKEYKWLFLLVIILLFLMFTVKYYPYSANKVNYLEICSLLIVILTIYTCLFMESEIFFIIKIIFAIAVVFVNAGFILTCLVAIIYIALTTYWHKFKNKKKNKKLRSHFNLIKHMVPI